MSDPTGADGISKRLEQLAKTMGATVNNGIVKTAIDVRNDAITSIQREQSSGQVYTRGSITHLASAPGDAPNTDTGNLVRNIAFENPRQGLAFVGTSVEYGKHLEFGTRAMDARPWLRPAMDKNQSKLQSNITNAIKEEISKVTKL